jgi:hypothetical protein
VATNKLAHLDQTVTCIVPAWPFGSGHVQLILVREGYGPVSYGGENEMGEMFEFLPDWQPLTSNPSFAPANGGATLGFSVQGFLEGWGWYRCVFRRVLGGDIQEMSMPARVNRTHALCDTPVWGSVYAASLEPVAIHLYDDDTEIVNQHLVNDSTTSTELPRQLPRYCTQLPSPSHIVFRPVWTQVPSICWRTTQMWRACLLSTWYRMLAIVHAC